MNGCPDPVTHPVTESQDLQKYVGQKQLVRCNHMEAANFQLSVLDENLVVASWSSSVHLAKACPTLQVQTWSLCLFAAEWATSKMARLGTNSSERLTRAAKRLGFLPFISYKLGRQPSGRCTMRGDRLGANLNQLGPERLHFWRG